MTSSVRVHAVRMLMLVGLATGIARLVAGFVVVRYLLRASMVASTAPHSIGVLFSVTAEARAAMLDLTMTATGVALVLLAIAWILFRHAANGWAMTIPAAVLAVVFASPVAIWWRGPGTTSLDPFGAMRWLGDFGMLASLPDRGAVLAVATGVVVLSATWLAVAPGPVGEAGFREGDLVPGPATSPTVR